MSENEGYWIFMGGGVFLQRLSKYNRQYRTTNGRPRKKQGNTVDKLGIYIAKGEYGDI